MTLAEIVAKLAGCPASEINPGFSLERPGLQGSLRRSVLIASIRRHLGVECMEAASAATFGELEAQVARAAGRAGKGPVSKEAGAGSGGPADAGGGSVEPQGQAEALSDGLRVGGLFSFTRCGIDIESPDLLPETSDYAGHEFYRASFTRDEIAYCSRQAQPRLHFAARWCAKEALKKCDPAFIGERMAAIEVVRDDAGRVSLRHHGPDGPRDLPHGVSLTHTATAAGAVVVGGLLQRAGAWLSRILRPRA